MMKKKTAKSWATILLVVIALNSLANRALST